MTHEDRIRDYVLTDLLYDAELPSLADDEPLVGPGMLDSMGVMRLVLWLEEEFGVHIPDEEVVPERLESVHAVAEWVRALIAGGAPSLA